MTINTKIGITIGVVLAGIIGVLLLGGNDQPAEVIIDTSSFASPRDVVIDFYEEWLQVATAGEQTVLPVSANITDELRTQLDQLLSASPAVDPILCTEQIPANFATKVVYTTDVAAEVMVSSRGLDTPGQALVQLQVTPERWVISGITCSNGEVAPEVEFTFDQNGNLLKDSLQPPLDASQWHLIYASNGQAGFAVPLSFSDSSMCASAEGAAVVCQPDNFTEAQSVTIKGQMQESGVVVERVE